MAKAREKLLKSSQKSFSKVLIFKLNFISRNFDDAVLLIDRTEVNLTQLILRNITQPMTESSNQVFIGGINSSDSRYAIYKSYSGCLSSEKLLSSFSRETF